ncbi:branched-chain amino acid ABC transporter permease [Actinomadura chibensis]|uniref:Branched-chain amino acid ABC transporter permease n=1 Tax=Actinomadura chibensis TaxID=392828 RepID=A0A5D0ND69_9ACTN|nr:branched-chain amino acid ABC transporter permease [Actinomadura chibensis]TYB42346.1 branched-chain amino acid ABC transporter permease [Actinomadura chibensis]
MTTIWAGLATGALYSLVAIGYNVVLLASGVVNFANAYLIMIGTFLAYVCLVDWGLPVAAAIPLTGLAVAVIAVVEERIAIRPLLNRHGGHAALITTVGVGTLLGGIAAKVWGTEPVKVPSPFSAEPLTLLGGTIQRNDLVLILLVLALGVGLHLWSRRTLLGLASLATAENRQAAQARGLNVRALGLGAFALAGLIAGLFAVFVAGRTYAHFHLGETLALFGFVAIAIGGSGSQLGGLIGGFTIGLLYAVTARYVGDSYPQIVVFAVFLLILLTRPRGLFGGAAERQV